MCTALFVSRFAVLLLCCCWSATHPHNVIKAANPACMPWQHYFSTRCFTKCDIIFFFLILIISSKQTKTQSWQRWQHWHGLSFLCAATWRARVSVSLRQLQQKNSPPLPQPIHECVLSWKRSLHALQRKLRECQPRNNMGAATFCTWNPNSSNHREPWRWKQLTCADEWVPQITSQSHLEVYTPATPWDLSSWYVE